MQWRPCWESHPLIAEATGNQFWGTGLHLDATCECLSEFWPGENVMGNILMQLHATFCEEQHLAEGANKCKAASPLSGDLKQSEQETDDGTVDGTVDGNFSAHT